MGRRILLYFFTELCYSYNILERCYCLLFYPFLVMFICMQITSEDVESEQARDKLFHCLLKECLSLNQLYALAEMLKYWPPSK